MAVPAAWRSTSARSVAGETKGWSPSRIKTGPFEGAAAAAPRRSELPIPSPNFRVHYHSRSTQVHAFPDPFGVRSKDDNGLEWVHAANRFEDASQQGLPQNRDQGLWTTHPGRGAGG